MLNEFDFLSYITDEFSFGKSIVETSFVGAGPNHELVNIYLR